VITTLLFIVFAGLAIGCAIAMVAQRNPLYSAISLIGVFISLASLYVMLAAPFIAAVQVIVYAGAIMVLVVFVIMLLNVEEEERHSPRLRFLLPAAVFLATVLIAEVTFILWSVQTSLYKPGSNVSDTGLTSSIGIGLFTTYLLPFEITSILLLMAIVGALSLARRVNTLTVTSRVVPGAQVLAMDIAEPRGVTDDTPIITSTTAQAARLLGVEAPKDSKDRE
jgi:NADH-quinone oxidoreductase subunit J